MRFQLGKVPETDFKPDESWTPLREPGPFVMQLCALPIGIATTFAVGRGWWAILYGMPPMRLSAYAVVLTPFALIASLVVLILVHEMIHALFHPQNGRTDDSVVGFWPRRLLFYAHFCAALPRDRFMAILIAPFMILSLLPLVVFACFAPVLGTPAASAAAWFSTWNALSSCGDLFGISILLWQVPRGAITRNQGWRTFWKPGAGRG